MNASRVSLRPPPAARLTSPCLCVAIAILTGTVSCRLKAQDSQQNQTQQNQTQQIETQLLQDTLPLRTALFQDPTLDEPLRRLVNEYRRQGLSDTLLAIYENQIRNFPQDVSSTLVLIRIQQQLGKPDAADTAEAAVARFPHVAYAHYLLAATRPETDPAAITALNQAIALERDPVRRESWIEELLPLADRYGQRDVLKDNLLSLAKIRQLSAAGLLMTAKRMQEYRLHRSALTVLEDAARLQPPPRIDAEIELASARSHAALGNRIRAAERLNTLLERVTVDHPLHTEILEQRVALLTTPNQQSEFVKAARQRLEDSNYREDHVRGTAQLLQCLGHTDEARSLLQDGLRRAPASRALESQLLNYLDSDTELQEKLEFLRSRVAQFPERQDLQLALIEAEYRAGEPDRAEERLAEWLAGHADVDRTEQLEEIAGRLRSHQHPGTAAGLLARAARISPGRIDLRLEAAERYLAVDDSDAAIAVLSLPIPATVEPTSLLELTDALIELDQAEVAREQLLSQAADRSDRLDLQLALACTCWALDERDEARTRFDRSRGLVDDAAGYRRWLKHTVPLLTEADKLDAFLRAEFERVRSRDEEASDVTQSTSIDMYLTLLQVASEWMPPEFLLQQIDTAPVELDGQGAEISLRRTLLRSLQSREASLPLIEQQVNRLLQIDAARASEYYASLAVAYSQNSSLFLKLKDALAHADVSEIADLQLLQDLRPAILSAADAQQTQAYFETLSRLRPDDSDAWRLLLACLLWQGDESGFRRHAQRLLTNADSFQPRPETVAVLREQIAISFWREAQAHVARGSTTELVEAIQLLNLAALSTTDANLSLVIQWSRTDCLRCLGNTVEYAEALRVFDTLAATDLTHSSNVFSQLPGLEIPAERCLVFPQGVLMNVDFARGLLAESSTLAETAPSAAAKAQVWEPANEASPQASCAWMFETLGGNAVTSVDVVGDTVVLLDSAAIGYGVDRETGRLLWYRETGHPRHESSRESGRFLDTEQDRWIAFREHRAPGHPVVLGDRFFVADADHVACYAVQTGEPLWQLAPFQSQRQSQPDASTATSETGSELPILLEPLDERLLAYDRTTQTLLRIDPRRGAIEARFEYSAANGLEPSHWNSGMALLGDSLLLYGPRSRLVNPRTGDVQCQFLVQHLPHYPLPIHLESESDSRPTAVTQTRSPSRANRLAPGLTLLTMNQQRPWRKPVTNELSFRAPFVHVHPLALWSSSTTACRAARQLSDGSLLLSSTNGEAHVRPLQLMSAAWQPMPAETSDPGYPASPGLTLGRRSGQTIRITPRGTLTGQSVRTELGPWLDAGLWEGLVLVGDRSGLRFAKADTGKFFASIGWPEPIAPAAAAAHSLTAVTRGALCVNATEPVLHPLMRVDRDLLFTRVGPAQVAALRLRFRPSAAAR